MSELGPYEKMSDSEKRVFLRSRGGATVSADNKYINTPEQRSGATPSGPAETSVEAGEEVRKLAQRAKEFVELVPKTVISTTADVGHPMNVSIEFEIGEGYTLLLSSALQAERRKTLEEACKAICAECRDDWKVERHESEARGVWWEHNIGNLSKDCDAKAIRALAAEGAEK